MEIEIVAQAGTREVALPDRRYVISVFAARLVSGEAKPGPEASEVGWFDIAGIAALDTTPGLLESAREAEHALHASKA